MKLLLRVVLIYFLLCRKQTLIAYQFCTRCVFALRIVILRPRFVCDTLFLLVGQRMSNRNEKVCQFLLYYMYNYNNNYYYYNNYYISVYYNVYTVHIHYRLLDILEVITPYKHFHKLREFAAAKLPPGFPVKIGKCQCACGIAFSHTHFSAHIQNSRCFQRLPPSLLYSNMKLSHFLLRNF